MNRGIKTENGKKKEIAYMRIGNFYEKNISKSPWVNNVVFHKEEATSEYTTMPVELRKEAENLVKVSSVFFRKLVEHPGVITREGGNYTDCWDRFDCFDKQGKIHSSIAFSDALNDYSDRVQTLLVTAM